MLASASGLPSIPKAERVTGTWCAPTTHALPIGVSLIVTDSSGIAPREVRPMTRTAEDILGAEAIAAVRRPIEKARGLPAGVLHQRGVLPARTAKVFRNRHLDGCRRTPVIFQESGLDAMPITVAGLPIILVRTQSSDIKAFHNVCRHRAAMVLTEPCKKGKAVAVPLPAAWAWDLDGKLRHAAPYFDGSKSGLEDRESWTASLWVWSPLAAPCGTTGSSSILTATPRRSRSTCSP